MRSNCLLSSLASLALCACALACGDDDVGTDAGGADASSGDATFDRSGGDAAVPPLCTSANAGCTAACELFNDCVVNSSLRDQLAGIFPGIGFTPPDWDDCTPCTARCEAGDPDGNRDALACFEMIYATNNCDTAADPTQAANAVNTCCAGQTDSSFCRETCYALLNSNNTALLSLFTMCEGLVDNALAPPTCVGSCPMITVATHIPVTGDAQWFPQSYAIHSDGSFAVIGKFDGGSIDFGGGTGAHTTTRGNVTEVVATFAADGTPRWSRTLSGGHAALPNNFIGKRIEFDDAGNLVVATDLLGGTLDLGAGPMTSAGMSDVLLASFTADGTLRWASSFGDAEDQSSRGLHVIGGETLYIGGLRGTIDLGGGPLTGAGMYDQLVARFDASGAHVWSRSYGTPLTETVWSIAGHAGGEYTIGGVASAGLDLGGGPFTTMGQSDAFVARFAADGTHRWSHVYGGPLFDLVHHVAADGDAVVAGAFFGPNAMVDIAGRIVVGPNEPLFRVEADGMVSWASDHMGVPFTSGFIVRELVSGPGGRIDLIGSSSTPLADLGGGPHMAARSTDPLIASYDRDGSYRWSMRFGGLLNESTAGVRRLASGELVVVAEMLDQIDYGSGTLTGDGRDLFVLRFAPD